MKRMLDIRDLSEYIGLKEQTIRNRLSTGNFPIPVKRIPGIRKPLFDLKDVNRYLDRLPEETGV